MRRGLLLAAVAFVSAPLAARVPVQVIQVVKAYPHDTRAFTEGLFFRDGMMFESTGLEGRSDIRRYRLEDGKVLARVALPPNLFGEGIVDWKDEIVSLTWRNGFGFRWNLASLKRGRKFTYPGEGWSLTRTDRELVMSDGTPVLRILDPVTFRIKRRVTVTADGVPVQNLNELEYVKGDILANIWMTDRIARIDPATGKVKAWIDLSPVVAQQQSSQDDVANGIAYDAKGDRLFVTGKLWSKLYEIRLLPAR
ncbi:glutaminyl-peptide cyclotransferase [Sphingomonas naphthae]|uniref:Glutaminyl-peptide cyclotransferase n=1 Tax=Sphingomonas naphthae TaxID=1813468 RepID=A0ABY7TJM6_9SPHN|nr:glutaminyl-peptide cyclotransferase [Sphingomonas naphthae]WCT73155.1 glutaminyl-peptide cyclotransferase [Sphingomonas naphthae]